MKGPTGLVRRRNGHGRGDAGTASHARSRAPGARSLRRDVEHGGFHLVGFDEVAIKGQTTFHWRPGGFFLEQQGAMNFLGMDLDSLELIGFDPETGTFPSTVFTNIAPTPLPYRWEIDGDTLKISVSYGPWTRRSPAPSTTMARAFTAAGVRTPAPTRR